MSIPNGRHVVEQLAAQHPQEWWDAHRPSGGGPKTEAFIRRLAWVLHSTVDPRFGLCGKRGNPADISDDALCYDGVSQLGDVDPTRGGVPVTVLDVIGGAGGPTPTAQWGAAGPATPRPHAAWVRPEPVGGVSSGGGGTPLPAPPVPVPGPDLTRVLARLDALVAATSALRAQLDAIEASSAAAASEALKAAGRASDIKTQIENLPAFKPAPAYVGRFPKPFGGSTEVTLTPKE
jgi:hypothetical protein